MRGTFGEQLFESLTDAVAHAKGASSGVHVRTVEVQNIKDPDNALKLSDPSVAPRFLGVQCLKALAPSS